MALEFLLAGRPFPADPGSLTIERRLNGCPTATFRARLDAPRLLTGAHPADALSPFAGQTGRENDPTGGALQSRDLSAQGYTASVALSTNPVLENGVRIERWECRLVGENGLPVEDSVHRVKVGDRLLFFRADGSVAMNEALPVVYVRAGGGLFTGAVRVAKPAEGAFPRAFPDVVRWRQATGNDVVRVERLATPARLQGLTAAGGDGQASLAWSELGGVSGYEYRRRRGAAPWGEVAAFAAGVRTGGTVAHLENGVLYTFQVRGFIAAAGGNLNGAWASVGVIPSAAPAFSGDQHDVQCFIGQAKTVNLPRLIGGELPYAYSVRPAPPSGLTFRAPTAPDGSPSIGGTPAGNPSSGVFTLQGADGTGDVVLDTFRIHVAAANANVQPYFVDRNGPDVRLIRGTAVGAAGTLPAAVSGNAPVVHSIVGTLPDGVIFDAANVRLTGTPTANTPLGACTLRATDADGEHADLPFRIAVAAPPSGPARPVWGAIPDVTLVAGRQAHHLLPAPAGGSPPIRYSIRGTALPSSLSLRGLTITGVPAAPAARAQYTIAAADSGAGAGEGVTQTFHLTVVAAVARPDAPTGLASTAGQNRQITVRWSNPGAPLPTHVEHQLQVGGAGAFGNRTRAPYPANHTLVIGGLGVDVTYVARIAFVNAAGTGAAADAPAAATLGRPTEITNARQTAASRYNPTSAITIGWAHDGARSITGFQYRYRESGAASYGAWSDVAGGATARSVTIGDLPFSKSYDVQLQAVNAAGANPAGRVQAHTPPTSPRNVRLTRPSTSGPNDWVVSWDPPTLPAGAPSGFITGYRVHFAYGATETAVDGYVTEPWTVVHTETSRTYPATDRSLTIRHQPVAGQYYRAWVYTVGAGGWPSSGAASSILHVPAPSQHPGSQAPPPEPTSEHRPADAPPKQARQAALPAPAWVGAVINAPAEIDVRWAAVAGATGYQYRVNVTNERGVRQSTHIDWTTVPGNAPNLLLATLNGAADAYYAVEVRATGSTESTTAERFGPWRTSWNGERPIRVTTAKPHGLVLDPGGGSPPQVQFTRLFGSDDFGASAADELVKHAFTVTDTPSDTSFTVQATRFVEEAPPAGARNPEWRQVLTSETVSKPGVPEPQPLRDEVIVRDTGAGPAEPLLARGGPRADWWNVVRVGDRVYWATAPAAPHGLANGDPVMLTTGDADYDGRPLGALVGALPDALSGLPGFTAANTFAFEDDEDDPFNLDDVIRTAAPRIGPLPNQITRITGAGDRKTLHVRATTGLASGSIVRLVGVTGVDSLNRYPAVNVSATTIAVNNPGGPLAIAPDAEAHWEAYTRTTGSRNVIRSLLPRGGTGVAPGTYRVGAVRGTAPAVGQIVQFQQILLDGVETQDEFIVTRRGAYGTWFEIMLRDSGQRLNFKESRRPSWRWWEVYYTAVPLLPRPVEDAVSSLTSSSQASPTGGHAWTLTVADSSPYRACADGSGGQANDGWVCLLGMLHGGRPIPPTTRFPVLAKTASAITIGRLPQTGVTRGDLTAAGVTGLGTAPLALPATPGDAQYQPLERARLFAGVVWSVRWEVAAGGGTAWYHLQCRGHAHVLDHRMVRAFYETPPDSTVRSLARHLIDTWVNPCSPPDRQIAAADATLYVTGPAKEDVWDWIPASEALTRLLDHQAAGIDGYWYVDEFRRLIVSQRTQPHSAAPLVLRQGRHIDGGAVTVDPARLVTVQTVIGFAPEAASRTDRFSLTPDRTAAPPIFAIRTAADGRQFVQLTHRPASIPTVRRAADGGTVDESVTEDPAAFVGTPVWILDRERGVLTRNTGHAQVAPVPAGRLVTINYVYSEPTVVTIPAGADHAALRDASAAVKAYGVLHRVHQDPALDDLARTQAAADALLARNADPARYADLVLLPDDPSLIRLREGQVVAVQAPALGIGRTGSPERPDAAQPAGKWLVESIRIDVVNGKPRLGCRLLVRDWRLPPGAPPAAAQRLTAPTRGSQRPKAPGAITEQTQALEGVRLPRSLGGAWSSSNTSNAADGARIAGGAVPSMDGSRLAPGALRWRAMAQTFGDAVIELFLWDVGAGARVAGSTLSSISETSPAARRSAGFTLAPELRRYELRCRLTSPATPDPQGGDEAWVWAAELHVGRDQP